jgi:farnesol dehydrogenase
MRVLVTGGTGYLGASIVRALHARGHHPVVFARRATAAALPGVPYDGDIRDRDALRRAADQADAVIHAAALVSTWRPRPQEFDEVNVGGLQNLLDVARGLGLARIVYLSSFLALPPSRGTCRPDAHDYQRTKLRALRVARTAAAEGLPLVTMFPGVVYGPGAETEGNLVGRLIRDHLHGRLPGLIGAENIWSYAYIEDVAAAHVAAIEREHLHGEFVLGGENVTQMRLFEILRDITGRPVPRRIPMPAAGALAAIHDARARWFSRPPLLTRGIVNIFQCDWSLDSRRSIRELNYRVTPLVRGLRLTVNASVPFLQP